MPVRLVSRMRFQSASVISSVGTRLVVPAAATTMSTFWKAERHASRSARSDPRSPTSAGWRSVRRPRASISAATLSTTPRRRPVDDDIGAGVGEPECERVTDAGGAADDDCRAAGEVEECRRHREARFGARHSEAPTAWVSFAWYERDRRRCSFIARRAPSTSRARTA